MIKFFATFAFLIFSKLFGIGFSFLRGVNRKKTIRKLVSTMATQKLNRKHALSRNSRIAEMLKHRHKQLRSTNWLQIPNITLNFV